MDLSIIIVHYNTFSLTRDCLYSIYAISRVDEIEIILVNNSDKDRPVSNLLHEFPDLQIITPGENLGFAKGNNLGIEHSRGEVILLLNSDTLINADSLENCYSKVTSDKKIGVISCQLRYPNGDLQHNCQPFPDTRKEFIEKLRLHKLMTKRKRSNYMQGFYFDYTKDGNPDWIWGTYFMFRREILSFLPEGKLNDDYFMYMEDMQWCWDIRKAGFEIAYDSGSFITHLHGGSNADKSGMMKASREIFRKNTGL